MKIKTSCLLAFSLAMVLCGCNPGTTVVADDGSVINADGKGVTLRASGHPNARITAAGDLEIDGKAVAVDAAQRALLQTYHREMNAMAADGLAIGKQGAALAGKALTETIKGAIKGNADDVESKIEGQAKQIEQQAMQLCKRLVKVKASQDALAAQLPAFKPYATMEQSDVDDCGTSHNASYDAGKEVGHALGKAMKDDSSVDAAAQADAAAAGETPAVESTSDKAGDAR